MFKQSTHPHQPAQITSNSNVTNSAHPLAAASSTVSISKITKEKHVLNFRISRQKHAKTHVKTVSKLRKIPGRGEEETFMLCPSPHFLVTPLVKNSSRFNNITLK